MQMSDYDTRLIAVEQAVGVLRTDCLQAIAENTRSIGILNKVFLQQEERVSNANHEITMFIGIVGSQGQDIQLIKRQTQAMAGRFDRIDVRFDGVNTHLE